MNKSEAEQLNKENFCNYMEQAYKDNKLLVVEDMYVLLDNVSVAMDIKTGLYMYTDAGKDKSNKRQYINIDGFMCPSYTFRVVFEGLVYYDKRHTDRYNEYKLGIKSWGIVRTIGKEKLYGPTFNMSVINHINGDTMDNSDNNLEITTVGLNNAHSNLMSHVAYYYPSLISTEYDCQGHAMHQWIDKVGISCKQIEQYNKTHNNQIKSCKNKKGEFTPKLTKEEVTDILNYFNKLETKQEQVKQLDYVVIRKQELVFDF